MVKNADSTLTSAQLRAARALVGLRAEDLAQETKLGLRTIRRAEREDGPLKVTPANLATIVAALEAHGVRFIALEEGGPGVALLPAKRKRLK